MRIHVEPEHLASEGARIDAAADAADSGIERAATRVAEVLSGSWSGASATAFMVAFARWQSAAEAGSAELHRLADGLLATARDVRAVEDQHTELIRTIQAELHLLPAHRVAPVAIIRDLARLMGGE